MAGKNTDFLVLFSAHGIKTQTGNFISNFSKDFIPINDKKKYIFDRSGILKPASFYTTHAWPRQGKFQFSHTCEVSERRGKYYRDTIEKIDTLERNEENFGQKYRRILASLHPDW